jgi:hypothetical protein
LHAPQHRYTFWHSPVTAIIRQPKCSLWPITALSHFANLLGPNSMRVSAQGEEPLVEDSLEFASGSNSFNHVAVTGTATAAPAKRVNAGSSPARNSKSLIKAWVADEVIAPD